MGREMSLTDMETAWVYYPCMQAADIFHMRLHVACAGIDQRKAHMLAREAAQKLGWKKPVSIHVPILIGLQGLQVTQKEFDENAEINLQISSKMSKSIPKTCVFVHDLPEEIEEKIQAAYCPPKEVWGNPVLQTARHVIFNERPTLTIPRSQKYGGPETFEGYEALEKAYVEGSLHPLDLKKGVADALIEILGPAREHFRTHPQNLERMKEIEITR